jgi:hypothetical protein
MFFLAIFLDGVCSSGGMVLTAGGWELGAPVMGGKGYCYDGGQCGGGG